MKLKVKNHNFAFKTVTNPYYFAEIVQKHTKNSKIRTIELINSSSDKFELSKSLSDSN